MIIGILVTAAGKSERFQKAGGKQSKLNYLLGAKTVFERSLTNAMQSHLPVHVVTRTDNYGVIELCQKMNVTYSLLDSDGLGDSIAVGIKNTADWDGWLIHLADMPYITRDIFIQVKNALISCPLVRPTYQGQPGHPVGISAKYRQDLINLSGDNGAKSILQYSMVQKIEINDKSVIEDIDYPLSGAK